MKHTIICCALGGLVLGASSEVSAGFITVGAFSTFNETDSSDTSGDLFTLTNNSDLLSRAQISSVSLLLSPELIFDTAPDGPGINPSSDFMSLTSITGGTVNSSTFDGSNLLTLNFTGFDPGETFSFSMDVDGLTGSDMTRRLVTGTAFSGTLFSVTFTGPTILGSPLTLSSTFSALPPFMAISSISEEAPMVISNPEPSSWLTLLIGVTCLGLIRFTRNRAKQNSIVARPSNFT